MINDTNHIDKLIEGRVDESIKLFAEDITKRIEKFLFDNGTDRHCRFYQIYEWHNGKPVAYTPISTDVYCETLQYIIAKTVKDKMVERDTKFLLDKMNSLIK
jgi:sulfatase maturation enzyme AslB (radical SAM superfamily)